MCPLVALAQKADISFNNSHIELTRQIKATEVYFNPNSGTNVTVVKYFLVYHSNQLGGVKSLKMLSTTPFQYVEFNPHYKLRFDWINNRFDTVVHSGQTLMLDSLYQAFALENTATLLPYQLLQKLTTIKLQGLNKKRSKQPISVSSNMGKMKVWTDTSGSQIQQIELTDFNYKISFEYFSHPDAEWFDRLFSTDSLSHYLETELRHKAQKKREVDSIHASINTKSLFKKYTLVNFWTMGCRGESETFAMLKIIRKKFDVNELDIINLSHDGNGSIQKLNKKYSKYFVTYQDTMFLSSYFGVSQFPSVLLIDKYGEVLYRKKGMNIKDLEACIKELEILLSDN